MSDHEIVSDGPERDGNGPPLALLLFLAIAGLVAAGWGVIAAVDALESDPDCGSYGYGGYGGYGCEPDHTDGRIDVEPSTGLVDRQSVTVTGEKFDPNSLFGAAQCDAALAPELQSVDACDLSTSVTGVTDAQGRIELGMRVRRVILVQGEEIDCADPGACIVGGATVTGFTPIEASYVDIAFDPAVPPVPRLTVDVSVDRITTREVSGLVTCNRGAQFSANAQLSQTKGSDSVYAYGYSETSTTCGTTPVRWAAPLYGSSGRLTGGPADYTVYAYAFDGFESVSDQAAGTTRLSGGSSSRVEPTEVAGATVKIEVTGSSGRGAELAVDVLVTCDRASDFGNVSVQLTQWAGLHRIFGYGNATLVTCNGPTPVSVPITPANGAFAGGPATARAVVSTQTFTPPGTWLYDSASALDRVKLQGAARPGLEVEPNPSSRITITGVTTDAVTGTVTCEQPASVYLSSEVEQLAGRTLRWAYGATEISCDGSTPFTIAIDGELRGGDARVLVSGNAYRRIDGDPYPTYEYLWNDYQAAAVAIAR